MTNDDKTMREESPSISPLLDLPDSLLLEALGYLGATDLYSFLKGISFCRAVAENQAFATEMLERERLPGRSLDDLLYHVEQWEAYKVKLRQGLFQIVLDDKRDDKGHGVHDSTLTRSPRCLHDEIDVQQVRKFLRDAIFNFTNRVAGAEQWYERLPLGPGTSFEFILSLTSNMRRVKGAWTELSEGDGTRVLPTWLSTQDYRKEYGFFNFLQTQHGEQRFRRDDPIATGSTMHSTSSTESDSRYLIAHDTEGNQFYVPGSCRPDVVQLTGVLHRAASGMNMYTRILQKTVESGTSTTATQALKREMLPPFARHYHVEQKLPFQAAREMQERAHEVISQKGQQIQPQDQSLIWMHANQVLLRQQKREWNAISWTLWKLCMTVYGPELTPSLNEMCFG